MLPSNVTLGQRVGWRLHPAVGAGSDKLFDSYGYKVIVTKIMFSFCLFLIGLAYIRWYRRWHIVTALLPFVYAFWLTVGLEYYGPIGILCLHYTRN